jgi:dATP/dGTP diphosphohydrolase
MGKPVDNWETKDSGEREQFESGMQRDTQEGKLRWDLVFDGPMLERWAGLLTRGAVKYDPRNWMKADGQEELDRFLASAARHFAQYMAGDEDEDHAAAVVFNLNGAEYVRARMAQRHAGALEYAYQSAVKGVPHG